MKGIGRIQRRIGILAIAGTITLPAMMVIASSVGDMQVSLINTIHAITNGLGITHYQMSPIEAGIIWQYRMSRTLMAVCCGGGLSLCGLVLQAVLRNSLADPYLLGISSGASTGAVCIMLLGFGGGVLSVGLGAFIGACAAFGLIMFLAGGMRNRTGHIILAGIAGSQLFNALTAYVVSTSANAEQSRSVMFWLLGSLSGVRWPDAILGLIVTVVGLIIVLCYASSLDTFTFGEEVAATLGIRILYVRFILLLTTALITATIVSSIGAVGFVGLVIPHITRMLVGPRHIISIPVTFLIGSHFMIIADLISRTLITHQVLPIGVVTALVGAPAFAFILYQNREKSF